MNLLGSGATGLTQLYDSLLGGSVTSWDVSAISQAYNHLMLCLSGRTDIATTQEYMGMRFNADSGSNYESQNYRAANGGTAATETLGGTQAQPGLFTGSTAPSGIESGFSVVIFHYTGTALFKSWVASGFAQAARAGGGVTTVSVGGTWRSTAAISRIAISSYGGGTNLVAGSRLTIYGLL